VKLVSQISPWWSEPFLIRESRLAETLVAPCALELGAAALPRRLADRQVGPTKVRFTGRVSLDSNWTVQEPGERGLFPERDEVNWRME